MPKLHQFNESCYHFKPDNRQYITLKDPKGEAKTVYKATNEIKKLVVALEVENGLMKEFAEDKKCDYLLLIFPNQQKPIDAVAYFIELKGQDLNTAFKQIRSSYDHLENELQGFTLQARIVISKFKIKGEMNSNPHFVRLRGEFGKDSILYKEYFNEKI